MHLVFYSFTYLPLSSALNLSMLTLAMIEDHDLSFDVFEAAHQVNFVFFYYAASFLIS